MRFFRLGTHFLCLGTLSFHVGMRATCAFHLGTHTFRLPQVIMEGPRGDHVIIANAIMVSRNASILPSNLTFADVKYDLEERVHKVNCKLKQQNKKTKKMPSACAFYLFSYVYNDSDELALCTGKHANVDHRRMTVRHPSECLWATVDFSGGTDLKGGPP